MQVTLCLQRHGAIQRRRKDFLIGGAQYVINYFVVQNIYGTDRKLGGRGGARAPDAPLVPTPMPLLCLSGYDFKATGGFVVPYHMPNYCFKGTESLM